MENIRKLVLLVMLLAIIPIASIGTAIAADFLYIGDGSDNTVRQFDADTGNFIGNFVSSASGGLLGPRGILFDGNGNLLVVNQNQGTDKNSEILQYDGKTGAFVKALVPSTDPNSFYNARGIVLKNSKLYVSDLGSAEQPGKVSVFDEPSGKFLGNLDQKNAIPETNYHPRGIVFGPDGNLYVAIMDVPGGLGGHVLCFNPDGSFNKVFIADDGGVGKLNRPEGLVFGPDGKLYITSFRDNNNPNTDTDSIRIYSAKGEFLRKIDLYPVGHPEQRAYAQALLFGPKGRLFVPVIIPPPPTTTIIDTGEVRRYNVDNGKYDSFVKAFGTSRNPWYLTFGKTDPSTLAYRDGDNQDGNNQDGDDQNNNNKN